jgi:hypothetical protein
MAELFVQQKQKKDHSKNRTVSEKYSDAYKALALEQEVDHDELELILAAAGKTGSQLLADVEERREKLVQLSRFKANQQAKKDRLQAEQDLQIAQQTLQEAIAKFEPALIAARQRLDAANYTEAITASAESWLCEHVQDEALLQREAALIREIAEVNAELKPLLEDREHKASSLVNAEYCLKQITGRTDDAWPTLGTINPLFWRNKDTLPAQQRVADLKSQLAQLDEAIRPRQAEQRRLQSELNEIHRLKLEP